MNYWMCNKCNYILQAEVPPGDTCPNCHKKCTFDNVTCYVPDCGGPDNIDHRLVQAKIAEHRTRGEGG